MCDCNNECCGREEEVEVTKEDIIQVVAEEIMNGECLGCNLDLLYNLAYSKGKEDLARESRDFYQDVMDEVFED